METIIRKTSPGNLFGHAVLGFALFFAPALTSVVNAATTGADMKMWSGLDLNGWSYSNTISGSAPIAENAKTATLDLTFTTAPLLPIPNSFELYLDQKLIKTQPISQKGVNNFKIPLPLPAKTAITEAGNFVHFTIVLKKTAPEKGRRFGIHSLSVLINSQP